MARDLHCRKLAVSSLESQLAIRAVALNLLLLSLFSVRVCVIYNSPRPLAKNVNLECWEKHFKTVHVRYHCEHAAKVRPMPPRQLSTKVTGDLLLCLLYFLFP